MIRRVQDAISDIQYAMRHSADFIFQVQDNISKIMDAIREVQIAPSSSYLFQPKFINWGLTSRAGLTYETV